MHLTREGVDAPALRPGLQRLRGHLVGPRRASEAEVDAAGREHLQHAELLGDLERRIMGEHHPARADADVARLARHLSDEDLRAGAREGIAVVVLGQPVAVIAQRIARLGERDGLGDGVGGVAVLADRRLVEDGEAHRRTMPCVPGRAMANRGLRNPLRLKSEDRAMARPAPIPPPADELDVPKHSSGAHPDARRGRGGDAASDRRLLAEAQGRAAVFPPAPISRRGRSASCCAMSCC